MITPEEERRRLLTLITTLQVGSFYGVASIEMRGGHVYLVRLEQKIKLEKMEMPDG